MIVTQGKNLFAEELESVLEAHPAIALASVHGVEDARRGAQVVAVLQWTDAAGHELPNAMQLVAWCRQSLEAFKAPKKFLVCADWPRTASGKTDHPRLARSLQQTASAAATDTPCLRTLP
jgi:acyl-CoA synthetase (AMP-forming)/AMP-acid ligase II